MEDDKEKNQQLENPIFVNRIDDNAGFTAEFLGKEAGNNVEPKKSTIAKTVTRMQSPRPMGPLL